ncbi:MAG: AmmeMemoRadiSam system protein B [Patescibacteria group bacterium]
MKPRSPSGRTLVAGFLGAVLLVGLSTLNTGAPHDAASGPYHRSQWDEYAPEVERALTGERRAERPELSRVHGLIVSHHIPVAIPELVAYYRGLKENQRVPSFVILGPDHNDAGSSPVSVSNARFVTVFGEVKPIPGVAAALVDEGLAVIDEPPFVGEHSIGSQVLLIAKLFPGASATPIILRSDATPSQAEALGRSLARLLDEETVIVASVDFSHYLSTEQAMPLDAVSGSILKRLDISSIPLIAADSKESLAAFMRAMTERGATATAELAVMNTNDLMQNADYTTGYIFGFWGMP